MDGTHEVDRLVVIPGRGERGAFKEEETVRLLPPPPTAEPEAICPVLRLALQLVLLLLLLFAILWGVPHRGEAGSDCGCCC